MQVRAHPRVEWMFQTPTLDEIVSVRGAINVVENPSLRAEVLEVLGPAPAHLLEARARRA